MATMTRPRPPRAGPSSKSRAQAGLAVGRNKLRYGRYLDILVTHAPPRGIHDQADPAHAGFDAFRWLIEKFQPRYHLHGHVHVYDRRKTCVTRVGRTEVVNVYPYRELTLDLPEMALERVHTAA